MHLNALSPSSAGMSPFPNRLCVEGGGGGGTPGVPSREIRSVSMFDQISKMTPQIQFNIQFNIQTCPPWRCGAGFNSEVLQAIELQKYAQGRAARGAYFRHG